MKKQWSIAVLVLLAMNSFSQSIVNPKTTASMKMNAGVITTKLAESKKFYTEVLGFGISFENEFYLLLHTPNHEAQISFLLPNHPSQQPFFHSAYLGKGMYLTIEVDDVDSLYSSVRRKNVPIRVELRDEPWGDRHFAIEDPNGIGIDVVKYTAPAK